MRSERKDYSFQELHKELSQLSCVTEFHSNLNPNQPEISYTNISPKVVIGYFQVLHPEPKEMKIKRFRKILEIYLYGEEVKKSYIKGELARETPQLISSLSRALA